MLLNWLWLCGSFLVFTGNLWERPCNVYAQKQIMSTQFNKRFLTQCIKFCTLNPSAWEDVTTIQLNGAALLLYDNTVITDLLPCNGTTWTCS